MYRYGCSGFLATYDELPDLRKGGSHFPTPAAKMLPCDLREKTRLFGCGWFRRAAAVRGKLVQYELNGTHANLRRRGAAGAGVQRNQPGCEVI